MYLHHKRFDQKGQPVYKINPYHYQESNSLIESNSVTSSSSNRSSRPTNKEVEQLVKDCGDLIEPGWESRHAKAIYKVGLAGYKALVLKAEKYGRSPKALLAGLVDKELR